MAIDIQTESLLSLTEATKALPRVNGKRPSISTLWRWCRRGLRGVRLEYIRVRNTFTAFADHHWRDPGRASVGSMFGYERAFKRRMLERVCERFGVAVSGDPLLNQGLVLARKMRAALNLPECRGGR